MIPQELEAEIAHLKDLGYNPEIHIEGQRIYIVFRDFPFGPAYSPARGDLLLYTSIVYPNAGFDMFWTDPNVKLANGGVPQAAEVMESYMGRTWRRFSWHLNRGWNPARDSLRSWLSYVEARLAKGV